MKIAYLGTSAAEGIPALFCHCDVCKYARKHKGKNIRTRSQVLIDDIILIDFGTDTYMHSLQYDISLADIYHCLITHTHDDHLYVEDLRARRRSRANLDLGTPTLTVYGGRGVKEVLKPDDNGFVTKDKSIFYQPVYDYSPFYIEDKYEIIPISSIHNTTNPLVYVIRKDDSVFLYAHDTDVLSEESLLYLNLNNIRFDAISLDCTEGIKHIDYPGHMNFERMKIMCDLMRKYNLIDLNTKIIANHFSHNGLISYDDAVIKGNELGYIISYDGMILNI